VNDFVPKGITVDDPNAADYWQFTLTETTAVTITGHRLEAGLDPAFFLFSGTFTDTDQFGGSLNNGALHFADDEIPEPPGLAGLFADPFLAGEAAGVVRAAVRRPAVRRGRC
jgi:hypothetical protein